MTSDELARSYFSRADKRMLALRVLMDAEAYPDVVREAQEIVELALKGMLRGIGVDPPKWHDVGTVLIEHGAKFPRRCGPNSMRWRKFRCDCGATGRPPSTAIST